MGRGLLIFAFLVTGGLTLILGRPASSQRRLPALEPVVVSAEEAESLVRADTLRRGEVLAQVLARHSLDRADVAEIVEALSRFANPRRLRPGLAVHSQWTAWDSLIHLTVQVDPDHVVHLVRDPLGWAAEWNELDVRVDTLVLSGRIDSNLYNSVMALPTPSLGAQERIERVMWGIYRPFQWAIDFGIDLRRGDNYRTVYERHVRPDGSVREARVLAAEFTNRGRTHQAFWLESRGEYFDENGQSMKMVFLKAPVDFRRISSRFTRRRYHPALGTYRAHLGTDYAADTGTRVYSTADGSVTRAGWWGGYGQIVEVRHVNGYNTRYAHLSFIAKGIRRGVRVSQGQLIGNVGSTGLATGPHLHYEMLRNGRAINHRDVNLPSGVPVSDSQMPEFRRIRQKLLRLMNGVSEPALILAE
ncbi:MAG: M23 family metallopeptidase [Gemmatimonadota bacterium]|nr:MAG: M23 family metallopeptidase [Gemmatimonadota bacterium]